tara:strand:+ start:2739 stop:3830 length:1092 start_codon:yes stop_codon:yes gene_type:complete
VENLKIFSIGHYVSRTGTLFLHSLLDNHPSILTIPGVIKLEKIIKKDIDNSITAFNFFEKDNPKFFDTSLFSPNDENNSGLWCLGEKKNNKILTEKNVFKDNFLNYLNNKKNFTKKNIILAIYYAYAKTHNMNLDKKKILLLHPHEKHICLKFNDIFPDSKFLIPIRDPVKVYFSIISMNKKKAKLRNQHYYPSAQLLDFVSGLEDFKNKGLNFYVIKFEDLNKKLKKKMMEISNYMSIDYDEKMLESTFGGYKYWGNSFDNLRDKYISSENFDYNNSSFKDLYFLKLLNFRISKKYNYNHDNFKKKEILLGIILFFFPLKDEIIYIKNFNYKSIFRYLKFILFFFPKRFILLMIVLKNLLKN